MYDKSALSYDTLDQKNKKEEKPDINMYFSTFSTKNNLSFVNSQSLKWYNCKSALLVSNWTVWTQPLWYMEINQTEARLQTHAYGGGSCILMPVPCPDTSIYLEQFQHSFNEDPLRD